MKNIFLAPRSNETSYENFESTIKVGRPYAFFESFLNDSEKALLPHSGNISVWATKESLRGRWEIMKPGDYVLFYANHGFYYSARVIGTKYSPELGSKLWPPDEDGKPWPCLFFLDNLREVSIPIKTVQELAEYEPTWDRVQGFMRLRDDGVQAIVEKFGTVEAFLNQAPEVYQYINNIIEKSKEENIEGEVEEIVDEGKLLEEALGYKDQGVSHVIKDSPHRVRVENAQQKRRIATIEGHACQICGWSLEWTNSKGKEAYRIDVDHIVDKAKGGGEEASNLWVLCPNCHVKKTLGVIVIDPKKKLIMESGREIKLHHDKHLKW